MKALFSPFRIQNIGLKNRIVMPAIASFLIEEGGEVTDLAVEHYRLRAAGGPAMVIVEACAVSPEGIVSTHQARIDRDEHVEGLAKIAAVMKAEGAVPAVQLHHGGRQISPKVIGRKPLAPSNLPCPTIRGDVEPLTVEGIQRLVALFGDAAGRAVEAGFQLIEIHGAHGYLIGQFLSRFSNIRTDAYGGDLDGRSRFAREVAAEVRRRVGPDFPISFKISAQEFCPDGLTVDESVQLLKRIIPAGVDVVQVSAGNDATPEWIAQPMFMKPACLADSAGQIKRSVDVPIMVVGRINHPVLADEIVTKSQADLVCIGRGLLADPEMPIKARLGRLEDIRTCIACNTCMESIFRRGRIECLVNPSLGRENEMAIEPTDSPREIMIVGGGPGGLNAAWVAAYRGHEVHLYDRLPETGGQLIVGSRTDYKKELLSLVRFLTRQAEKYGVRFHLGHEVTLDTVRRVDPDVVVLATGSRPAIPPIPGADHPMVTSYLNALNGGDADPRKTVVMGGGATGCEVAYHLAQVGADVTIVEQLPKIGRDLESMTRKMLFQKLQDLGAAMMTEAQVLRVADRGVLVSNGNGEESWIEAQRVVVAVGPRPDTTLYEALQPLDYEIHRIGDCLEPRNAKTAILEGAIIGRKV